MVKKNDSIELSITGYTAEGSGVGRFFPEENTGKTALLIKRGESLYLFRVLPRETGYECAL